MPTPRTISLLALSLSLSLSLSGCAADAQRPSDASGTSVASLGAAPVAPDPTTSAAPRVQPIALSAEQRALYDAADVIVVAKLVSPQIVTIDEMMPPRYHHEIGLAVEAQLAGTALPPGARVHFGTTEIEQPFEEGARMIVALRRLQGTLPQVEEHLDAVSIVPATPGLVAALERPALPEGLSLTIAQVPATQPVRWVNEYGDGEFVLRVANLGAAPAEVPGLERRGGEIAWRETLTVLDDAGRVLKLPTRPGAGAASPVVLAPGETIETRVDVKPLGLVHPMGGYRAYYSFRLGQLRASSFFYYDHLFHGPMMGKI